MRRLFVMVVALLILVSTSAKPEEDQLTEEETQTLIDLLAQRDEEGRAFVVLPDNFKMPATGLDGEYRLLILGIDQPGDKIGPHMSAAPDDDDPGHGRCLHAERTARLRPQWLPIGHSPKGGSSRRWTGWVEGARGEVL